MGLSLGDYAAYMVALTLAEAMREKFGGDHVAEMRRNFESYRGQLREY